jgi:UDP-2-acetamido-3-amino-2,3-dideoxy-glucuronate N-acetyltransferase
MPVAGDFWAHPTAIVDAGADIGEGTKVWHFCHVMPGARIGKRCSLGQNVFVAGGTSMGDNVKLQNNVSVYEGVHLADDVFCGPSMVFTNVANPRSHVSRKSEYRPTRVGKGATLGANCTVVCGHDVGRYAFVAAGAVVASDVPDFALVMGGPGRVRGYVCQCGERLALAPGEASRELGCAACGWRYRWDGRTLAEVRA